MSFIQDAVKKAALPWVKKVLEELLEDDGTEAYSFPGRDETGAIVTFGVEPTYPAPSYG